MKKLLISILVLLSCSCKRDADWHSIHPDLAGKWHEMSSSGSQGGYCTFSGRNYMDFVDLADLSVQDDVRRHGEAKYKKGQILLGESRFKILEYPIPYDTTIWDGVQSLPTHFRMKMKRAGNYQYVNGDEDGIFYYRE